jgi:type II secretory pathway pseudopilin PulG
MPHTTRPAFTVVEALVATTVIGVASAALAAALTATGTLRARAAVRVAAATLPRARIAALAARSCAAPDTAGGIAVSGLTGTWVARRTGAAWTFSDSVHAGPADVFRFDGSVSCRP